MDKIELKKGMIVGKWMDSEHPNYIEGEPEYEFYGSVQSWTDTEVTIINQGGWRCKREWITFSRLLAVAL
jgi:hypothetical protein